MGLRWDVIQNSGSEGLTSEVPVVKLGQTSKTPDVLIIPTISDNNQPMSRLTGVTENQKFALNEVGLGL